jgi:hypothetical protein
MSPGGISGEPALRISRAPTMRSPPCGGVPTRPTGRAGAAARERVGLPRSPRVGRCDCRSRGVAVATDVAARRVAEGGGWGHQPAGPFLAHRPVRRAAALLRKVMAIGPAILGTNGPCSWVAPVTSSRHRSANIRRARPTGRFRVGVLAGSCRDEWYGGDAIDMPPDHLVGDP